MSALDLVWLRLQHKSASCAEVLACENFTRWIRHSWSHVGVIVVEQQYYIILTLWKHRLITSSSAVTMVVQCFNNKNMSHLKAPTPGTSKHSIPSSTPLHLSFYFLITSLSRTTLTTLRRDVAKLHRHNTLDLNEKHIILPEHDLQHRFEDIYVLAEVDWLKRQPLVKKAIEERGMQIHAFVWDEETNSCVQLIAGKPDLP